MTQTEATIIVEQRHRDAAADYIAFVGDKEFSDGCRAGGENDKCEIVQAFARFDTERTAELERENAALREAGDYLRAILRRCEELTVIEGEDEATEMTEALANIRGLVRVTLTNPLPQFFAIKKSGGMRAKPLQWYKPTDHPQDSEGALWMAHGIGGRYSIQGDGGKFIVWTAADEFSFETFGTVEACKAWAESDWQQSFARNALGGQP